MAAKKSNSIEQYLSTERTDIERDVGYLQNGLKALHEIARTHGSGISGAALSTCVESMSLEMQVKCQHILDILESRDLVARSAGVAHG